MTDYGLADYHPPHTYLMDITLSDWLDVTKHKQSTLKVRVMVFITSCFIAAWPELSSVIKACPKLLNLLYFMISFHSLIIDCCNFWCALVIIEHYCSHRTDLFIYLHISFKYSLSILWTASINVSIGSEKSILGNMVQKVLEY